MTRTTCILLATLAGCPRPERAIAPAPAAVEERSAVAMGWYLRARLAEQRGDAAEAERSWEWVLRLDRGSPWPLAGYAAFLEGERRTDEAIAAWERAAAIERAPRVEAGLGGALLAAGRADEARPHLERAVAGGATEAWAPLAKLADDLHAHMVAWKAADPSAEADLARARAWAERGRPGEAVDALLRRLDDEEVGPEAAAALVPAMDASCRFATVGAWLDGNDAWDLEPPWSYVALEAARALGSPRYGDLLRREDPEAWALHEGRRLAAEGRHSDVLAHAARMAPGPWTEILRITSLVELGRPREAHAMAEKAAAAWPGDPTVAMALAAARLAHGRPIGDALDRLPEPARSERLADAAWLAGNGKLAEEALRAALDAGSALAARQLVAVLDTRGDAAGARSVAERWVALEPGSADAWVALAEHDPGQRMSALDRALAADPCHPEARILAAEAAKTDCALWLRAWETSPGDARLAPGRAACPGIPGPLEVP